MSNTAPKKKHHPPAAPKPAPKPAEPADAQLSWAYPFTPTGKSDATDPMTYFTALAKCENGFYPMGVSGMWHGGVHFAEGSAEMLKQDSGVRAIADGKIVAYRLNTQYEETTYPNNVGLAHYSTGFVLVRHELKLPPVPPKPAPTQPAKPASAPASAPTPASTTATPPAPAPADSTPSNSKSANDKSLVFFSLYMHTMDWKTYQKAIEQAKSNPKPDPTLPAPMSYWEGDRYYRVGAKAKDQQTVEKPKAPAQSPAAPTDPAGNLPNQNAGGDAPSPENSDQDAALPTPETGLHIRELPNGKSKILGVLPTGAEVIAGEGDPAHPDWIKIKAVKSGTILPAVVGKPVSPQAPWSYVFKGELDAVVDPKPLDTVVILKVPQRVKAGEVLAHVGQYQWPMKASPIPPQPNFPMLHLEVFAGSDFKDFMDQSRNRAKELNDTNKPLLEIEPGAKLVSEIPEPDQKLTQAGLKLVPLGDAKGSRWVKVQPKSVTNQPAKGKQKAKQTLTDVGTPMWVESSLANTISTANVPGWQNFPLDVSKATGPGADFRDVLRRTDLGKLGAGNIAVDDKGHHWWNITIGSKDGSERQGWICDTGHPHVQFRSSWEWPGFELVDNGSVSPADMFKRHVHTTEQYLADEDGTEFMGVAAKVNAGELITKLEKAIDTNNDGKVSAQELKHALETRWMAEAVSHLVVRNETEWGGGLGKWEELTPLMQKQTEMWKTELDRLAKLQWWEKITGVDGFPTDLSPWHLHPIGLIGNFIQSGGECDCGCCMTVTGTRFMHTKLDPWYGPQHSGKISLGNCPALATMRAKGTLGEVEEKILRAMSQNEGCVDTVQAIDIAIISAGAMQKTIRGDASGGELAVQIAVFRDTQPDAYQQYFANCGWTVTGSGGDAQLGYAHPTFTNGARLIGPELYKALRRDCSENTMGKPVKCPPVASMAHGVSSPLYQELQIKDFVDRLNQAINKYPNGYSYRIKDYLQSPLGRATTLDQDVNWPGATSDSMRESLDRFFSHNPQVSRNPADWGANRGSYETSILQDYGPTRAMAKVNGASVAPGRYQHLVQALGMPS